MISFKIYCLSHVLSTGYVEKDTSNSIMCFGSRFYRIFPIDLGNWGALRYWTYKDSGSRTDLSFRAQPQSSEIPRQKEAVLVVATWTNIHSGSNSTSKHVNLMQLQPHTGTAIIQNTTPYWSAAHSIAQRSLRAAFKIFEISAVHILHGRFPGEISIMTARPCN
jgi:hypothetical protein